MRVRRSAWLLFFCDDARFVDIGALLRGAVEPATLTQLYALSLSRGRTETISGEELALLLSFPSDSWRDPGDADVDRLLDAGLLIREGEPGRDEQLRDSGWHPFAAAHYFLTRWRGVELRSDGGQVEPPTEAGLRELLALRGTPPPAFHRRASERVVPLPRAEASGELYDALAKRQTTRRFTDESLPAAQLAFVLQEVFGCRALATAADAQVVTLRRSSPSAGGLHPLEPYLLVSRVDGIPPGLYHYDAETHALEQLEELAAGEARELATRFVCGQDYFGSAHALILLAARFVRSHWKYRRHPKAYTSILLDAGHLSQTLYLVAAQQQLGAFVTSVINNAEIDDRLGIDGIDEGVVCACGIGLRAGRSPFDPVYKPFTPGARA